jgi:hypothetical protein
MRNGSQEESAWPEAAEAELLRAHWVIGLPFVELKSLVTMSNTKGVRGFISELHNKQA